MTKCRQLATTVLSALLVLYAANAEDRNLRGLQNNVQQGEEAVERKVLQTKRVILHYKTNKTNALNDIDVVSKNRFEIAHDPAIKIDFEFDELNTIVVSGTPDEISDLSASAEIDSIQDDPIRYPLGTIRGSISDVRKLQQYRPYGVDLVQAPSLWAQGATGNGVRVCVIDSGIDQGHPDFVTSKLSGYGRWYEDNCGHGTHVSGTISGRDDTAGVVGVSPNVEIFTVKIFGDSCGATYSSGITDAARVCQQNGADIISMSLGGPYGSSFESNFFSQLYQQDGILLVAAAGNDGNSAKSYPASYDSVVSVGAVDSQRNHADFSQYNNQVDIVAPGVNVLSTFPTRGCKICGWSRNYGAINGTSMAAPHVSAVAALLKSAVPLASMNEIRTAIESTAMDLGPLGRDDYYGHGLVQAQAALNFLKGNADDENNEPPIEEQQPPPSSGECTDTPGWHDSDGYDYNCEWYASSFRCTLYGGGFENQRQTANEACCVCGGGNK